MQSYHPMSTLSAITMQSFMSPLDSFACTGTLVGPDIGESVVRRQTIADSKMSVASFCTTTAGRGLEAYPLPAMLQISPRVVDHLLGVQSIDVRLCPKALPGGFRAVGIR